MPVDSSFGIVGGYSTPVYAPTHIKKKLLTPKPKTATERLKLERLQKRQARKWKNR